MSGTRKMEKFELDAYTETRETTPAADLPARPFEPRTDASENGLAPELPALPFTPRLPESDDSATESAAQRPETPGAAWEPGEWVPPQKTEAETAPETAQDPDALRTRLARKFISLADSFTEAFKDFAIAGGAYTVELTTPQGMSTGGGKQALQHIRLRPRRQGDATLVAGTVNQVERRAELRDFDHIAIMFEVRFRQTLQLASPDWEEFLRRAEVVLNTAGIQSMRTPPPRDLLNQRRSMKRVSKRALIVLGVVLFFALLVVWRVLVVLATTP